ncbi:hypothetical protein MRB53_001429 [Persea americana]|uniref:Uncharacterized protein n=1 Tax=Persea americana TaxID=3435 RepID=A0ACC2MRT2_PERAE|nr:hypothetical protein MRB53_001429 [Persea americana]
MPSYSFYIDLNRVCFDKPQRRWEAISNGEPELQMSTSPFIGFGTAGWPFSAPEGIKEAILNAIELGYRHFDSAATYHSEKPLGEAIAEALHRGLINSRGELFFTSKLWCCDAHYDRVLPALQMSLRLHK